MTLTTEFIPGRGARATVLAALVSCLATSASCRDDDPAGENPPAGTPAVASARAPASLDLRTQYDLARALTEVETSRDPDSVALGYHKIRTSWTGKRYRWRVRVIEPLCRSRDACNVLPFDRTGRDKNIVHGWLPHLVLDDTAFAAIRRTCAGKPACQIEMEGTLSEFLLDTEYPTSLKFRDVRVL